MKLLVRDLPIMNRIEKKTDPYYQVFKDGVKFKQQLYQSEVLKNKTSGVFRTYSFGIEGERSLEKPMLIEFWNKNAITKNQFIGIVRVSDRP
jgi:hypothetical protein